MAEASETATKSEEISKKTEEIKNDAADAGAEAEEPSKEEAVSIYDSDVPNRVIVGRNHPLSFYVDRARRVFRMEDEVHVTGRGDNIATACKLVEALKRQQIAVIEKISTGMNVEPFFTPQGDARWGPPSAVISFTLKRGELGEYISDYQQRKIIEIFEKNDEECTGSLSLDKVEALELESKFQANEEQSEKSKQFKAALGKKSMDLPTFIKFASISIHPLLKNRVFKDILSSEFNIEVSGQRSAPGAGADAGDDDK